MIIFVGETPSKKNISKDVAFVGTKSYKRLLEWIWELDLSVNEVMICNLSDINKYNDQFYMLDTPHMSLDIMQEEGDRVIALGNKVEKELNKIGLSNYKIDHPSGMNRNLNDKKYTQAMLENCKAWLRGEDGLR